jgi:glutathione S-transferase
MTMKLYMHPVSTASRPVRLFIAEKKLPVEEQIVDLLKGEHYQEPFCTINPNRLVPVLEDGDLRLTESATILKYLAAKHELPEYPTDLKKRAKVDEVMDWFNTQCYRELGYHLIYPQIFPHHKRPSEEAQQGTIEWGKEKTGVWLEILDRCWIGKDRQYLTGDQITVADYFGSAILTLGEIIRCDYSGYPNVSRWIGNMKKLGSWNRINEALAGFTNMVKDQPFKAIQP